MRAATIRPLAPTDSIEELTALLHRAYAELAAMGLRYSATHQSSEVTAARASEGECALAVLDGVVVGTITLVPPDRARGTAWYDRSDVATFGQFGVEPHLKRHGIGSALLEHVVARALALGARELACDTSERALHLIEYYARRGFRQVGFADWRPHTNYRSVILSRALSP